MKQTTVDELVKLSGCEPQKVIEVWNRVKVILGRYLEKEDPKYEEILIKVLKSFLNIKEDFAIDLAGSGMSPTQGDGGGVYAKKFGEVFRKKPPHVEK